MVALNIQRGVKVCPHVAGGILFGVGTVNVIISILPPFVLRSCFFFVETIVVCVIVIGKSSSRRIISFMGYPSDQKAGMKMLNTCSQVTKLLT